MGRAQSAVDEKPFALGKRPSCQGAAIRLKVEPDLNRSLRQNCVREPPFSVQRLTFLVHGRPFTVDVRPFRKMVARVLKKVGDVHKKVAGVRKKVDDVHEKVDGVLRKVCDAQRQIDGVREKVGGRFLSVGRYLRFLLHSLIFLAVPCLMRVGQHQNRA